MTAILGLSAFYHDSAATLVVDGKIVAAAQEERFTRIKHDKAFPENAIAYCLSEANLSPADLSYVGFYEKPLQKFDRLLESYLSYAPRGFGSFLKAIPQWAGQKLHLRREISRGLNTASQSPYQGRVCFCEHHESHAASAFYPSPFDEAAILTMDGVGEWATTTLGVGRGNEIELTNEIRFPHSLGLLYSAFTYYCGFRVNSGEYKLMGLAPYGEPKYADLIRQHLIEVRDDGSFRLDMDFFNYGVGLTMTGPRFHQLFGREPRKAETSIEPLDMDLAASIQAVTEEVVLKTAKHLHQTTGQRNLCMAGGVALNCVANGILVRESPFENVWIQPASGDAGGALGVAMLIWHQLLDSPRKTASTQMASTQKDSQQGSLLGPEFTESEIRDQLDQLGGEYEIVSDETALAQRIAGHLSDGLVVGWMQGRMEFGPRALGNRSILGDPRCTKMQSTMNLKIKFRESFRPFAPIVLKEHAADYFQIPDGVDSPYMMLVFDVNENRRLPVEQTADEPLGVARVNAPRSDVPAVTHVDYSARIQTVDATTNPRLEKLMRAFHDATECPVLINTSFNIRGEPIVCTPSDAFRCFMATNMDVLVINDFVLLKQNQGGAKTHATDEHLAQFQLD